ncbi:MAG: hypothetical protein VM34scaffold347_57 [Phage 66_12]|jgi:hypothetical protein|nr:MAG: hypothetical protein VM34scaffold347_57 [Phage 66_12]
MTRKEKRHCGACGVSRPTGSDEPDPCLGCLPNVRYACCGHGSRRAAYVVVADGSTYSVRGDEAIALMRELGGNPPTATHDRIGLKHTWPKD